MGLSLGQLASRLGRTAASVRSWERGEEELDADLLVQVAEVLELDPSELGVTADREAVVAAEPPVAEPPVAEPPGAEPDAGEPEPGETEPGEPDAGVTGPGPGEPALPVAKPGAPEAGPAVVEAAPIPVAEMPEADRDEMAAVTAPDPLDTVEEGTEVEGRAVVPPMPENPTYEAEVVVVTDPQPLVLPDEAPSPVTGPAAPAPASAPDVGLLDAPTAAIPVEEMEREAKRARASTEALPAGAVVVPHYLDDPRERRRYWIRAGLTAVALFLLLVAVLWSAGHLGDALGEVLDQFGSSVQ